ncbi:MAG: histidine kinase [Gaiella sp.]|nr:histidine kinase [Gaiella sp.]
MKPVKLALALLAVPLGVIAFRLLHEDLRQTEIRSLPAVVIGWTAIATGLLAWWQRPANRMGLLMTLFGFAVLIRPWQYSGDPWLFVIGLALGSLGFALFGHVALAYPTGRVVDRLELWLVRAGYATVLAFPLAILLVTPEGTGLEYAPLAPESPLLVTADAELARALERALVIVFFGFLTACFVVLLIRKFVRATPRARRILLPLLLAAGVAALRAFYEFLSTFGSEVPAIADYVYWWQVAGQVALSFAIVWGLLYSRLAAAHVADLVRELDRVPPERLRDALARAVDDPTLELAFWLPERDTYADAAGRPVALPAPGARRAVAVLETDGEPVAALVHDPSLRDDPRLLDAAGAAARLAIENARLQAELRAKLVQVQESRARIVAAGDDQRRRLERNLHDGAQQRLVALALELRAAQKRLGGQLDPELEDVLADAVDELQLAVGELRELARGVHPAILTEEGLAAALESLADRTPIPVRILAAPADRLPSEIEGAAYFVACEALANAVKHAEASAVTISAARRNGTLVVEVADDGVGGASLNGGSGLHGLADRLEAHGGSLRIDSPPGGGTRVIGELPCAL